MFFPVFSFHQAISTFSVCRFSTLGKKITVRKGNWTLPFSHRSDCLADVSGLGIKVHGCRVVWGRGVDTEWREGGGGQKGQMECAQGA